VLFDLKQFLLKISHKAKQVHFGAKSTLNQKTVLEGNNYIWDNTDVRNSHIGFGTYIAKNSSILSTYIGRYCSIGENVRTSIGRHPSHQFVSTHPAFFSPAKQAGFTFVREQLFSEHKYVDKNYLVQIGNDVWIGNNVTILDGITIGDGAIVGLGSVVTKDVDPYSINVGVPCKCIGQRFEKEEVEFLLSLQWWNKGYSWVKEHATLFADIKALEIKCR